MSGWVMRKATLPSSFLWKEYRLRSSKTLNQPTGVARTKFYKAMSVHAFAFPAVMLQWTCMVVQSSSKDYIRMTWMYMEFWKRRENVGLVEWLAVRLRVLSMRRAKDQIKFVRVDGESRELSRITEFTHRCLVVRQASNDTDMSECVISGTKAEFAIVRTINWRICFDTIKKWVPGTHAMETLCGNCKKSAKNAIARGRPWSYVARTRVMLPMASNNWCHRLPWPDVWTFSICLRYTERSRTTYLTQASRQTAMQ